MNIGRFDTKIIIKLPSSGSIDRFGQRNITYATSSVWALVEQKSGNQDNTAGIINNSANVDFTVRYTGSINEDCEVVYESRSFNINFIEEVGTRDSYLRLACSRDTI